MVIEEGGKTVIDHHGDMVEMPTLQKAAHKYITDARIAKAMHRGDAIGEVVESVVIDDEFVKAIGATTDKRGWWIGMRVYDEQIQKRIASGELRAFSIGGRGRKKRVS